MKLSGVLFNLILKVEPTWCRVVSVSGFPENTSMAVVVEAFEKQGKILVSIFDDDGGW